jgi:hypothetical protein
VVKKRVTPRKPARKAKPAKSKPKAPRGDRSRLDLEPLQRHIRKRIKDLESGGKPATAGAREAAPGDDTIERLKNALETLEDICHPSMDIPI